MNLNLPENWNLLLSNECSFDSYRELFQWVEEEYQNKTIYPPKELIFNAFELCDPKQLKVVILGQDPYHGQFQANGLAFSVPLGVKQPPSLVNILKELTLDEGIAPPLHGELERWARQGVLLLNAALTVIEAQPSSHQKQWAVFTDQVISTISSSCEQVVFLLWGGFAQKKLKLINLDKHCVLTSGHPSPLSANKGHWFGNKHFSKANEYLVSQGKTPIDWSL